MLQQHNRAVEARGPMKIKVLVFEITEIYLKNGTIFVYLTKIS